MLKKLFIACLVIGFIGLLCVAAAGTWGYYYISRDLPDFHTVEDYRPPVVTKVYSNDNTLVGEFYTERRYPIKLKDIPVLVRNAFLAAEDANFYAHSGVDWLAALRVAYTNAVTGSRVGASTITMQVARNFFLTRERAGMAGYLRKANEVALSFKI